MHKCVDARGVTHYSDKVGGKLVEVPIYAAAKRLLESAERRQPARKSKSR